MTDLPTIIKEAADNLALHMSWVQARVPGMNVIADDSLVLADSGLATDTFNTMCRTRLESGESVRIRGAIEYFQTRGRAFSWWLGPGDTPAGLAAELQRAGLHYAESELAMAVRLGELPASPALPDGLEIRRVRTAAQLSEFATINAENWDPPDADVMAFFQKASGILLTSDCPLWLFLGYLQDEAVATAEVAMSGRTAGLYNVSTRAEHRRKGIGMAMTIAPLLQARDAGMDLGILQAASAGVSVYTRAGFVKFGEYREFKPD